MESDLHHKFGNRNVLFGFRIPRNQLSSKYHHLGVLLFRWSLPGDGGGILSPVSPPPFPRLLQQLPPPLHSAWGWNLISAKADGSLSPTAKFEPRILQQPAHLGVPPACSRAAFRRALGQEPPRRPLLPKGAMQSAISSSCHEENGSSPCTTPPSASLSPSAARLWRPAAQRNLRNRWSKLLSSKKQWESAASEGRSNATALVNAYLSRRYMPNMNLGVLKDMPEIRQKAGEKLARKQEQCQSKLLSSYKDLVGVVYQLVEACGSMRCFLKGSSAGPLIQFTHHSEDKNDPGDGGGIAVFTFWPLPYFEKLAQELVGMYVLELSFKRLIVVQLLCIACQDTSRVQIDELNWSTELYDGEFDDLDLIGLFSKEKCQPISPGNKDFHSDNPVTEKINQNPDREVLQVYLTAWISDVNIDMKRFDEILAMVEEEMKVKIS